MDDDNEYFLATLDKDRKFLIYSSETFKLSEIDILTLIKICMVEQRSKVIGKKILEAYKDSTEHRKDITRERLEKIGVIYDEKKPTIRKKPRTK